MDIRLHVTTLAKGRTVESLCPCEYNYSLTLDFKELLLNMKLKEGAWQVWFLKFLRSQRQVVLANGAFASFIGLNCLIDVPWEG